MAIPPFPPLRIREEDGSPNTIPILDIIVSNNTLTDAGGGTVRLATGPGNSTINAGSQNNLSFYTATATTLDDTVPIGPRNTFVAVDSASDAHHYKQFVQGNNITIAYNGTAVTFSAATGAGAAAASTAELYVVIANTDSLSSERALTAGLGVTIADSGANAAVYIQAATPFLVASNRTITAGAGLTGGGNLGADRTLSLATPVAATSGGTGVSTYAVGDLLYADNTSTPLARLAIVNSNLFLGATSTGTLLPQWKQLVAGGNVTIAHNGTAVTISSLQTTTGNVYAATGNSYVLISNAADLTADRALAVGGLISLTDGGANGTVTLATTAKTVLIPLALLTVQPDTANCFWAASAGTTIDFGRVRYVDSGEGISTWWGILPWNLASTPAYNLLYYHGANSAAVGNVMVTARGRSITHGEVFDGAYTVLSSAATYSCFIVGSLNVSAVSGGTFDSVLATSATDYFYLEVNRHGGNASDTISSTWDLYGVALRVNVN